MLLIHHMFASTAPGRHGWDDKLTYFDLGQQIIISASCGGSLFGSSCAVPLLLAFMFRTCKSLYARYFLKVSFLETSWRLLEISLSAPGNRGWPAVRVGVRAVRVRCACRAHRVPPAYYRVCRWPRRVTSDRPGSDRLETQPICVAVCAARPRACRQQCLP